MAARLNEARMMMNELDRSVDEHAAISARTEAAAPARKPPPEPAVDFVTEWEERFQGMRAAPEGSPQPARVADELARAMPNNALVPTSAARVAAINAAAQAALSAGHRQARTSSRAPSPENLVGHPYHDAPTRRPNASMTAGAGTGDPKTLQ